jgi:regulatory protein
MDLLARREHSRRELAEKLTARGFETERVARVLDELEQDGLLSAERFAQSFVAARYAKGQGPRRIRAELTERGIESADDYLHDERFDWVSLARSARVKRFGPAPPKDLKDKARQVRFLEYRGFGHDQIRRALEFDENSD